MSITCRRTASSIASKTDSSSSSSHAFHSDIKFAHTCSSGSTFIPAPTAESGVYLSTAASSTDASFKHDGGGAAATAEPSCKDEVQGKYHKPTVVSEMRRTHLDGVKSKAYWHFSQHT